MMRPAVALFVLPLVVCVTLAPGCKQDLRPTSVSSNGEAVVADGDALHPVLIAAPPAAPSVSDDASGVSIPCGTCHTTRAANIRTASAEDLDEFHQGLQYAHGSLTCLSCHHADDYDSLRHADGRKLPYAQVMKLCSQCHGPQARDYRRGSHGGGTGYWDQRRGPKLRNHCVHCHDPHSPAFPRMQPTFKPRDRFLTPVSESAAAHD